MKALIVDDVKMVGKLLANFLAPYGEIKIVPDGWQAIVEFNQAWMKDKPFELVCLDIMLPVYSGYDVLRSFRKIEDDAKIPKNKRSKIVMISALYDEKNITDAYSGGCDGYITKPFSQAKVLEELEKLGLINVK